MRATWTAMMMMAAAARSAVGSDAAAQNPPTPLIDSLARCAAIVADPARLACYDSAAPKLIAAEHSKDVVVVTREEVKATKRKLFGLPVDQNAVFAGHDAPADRVDELHTTVTAASAGGGDSWTLTLAEGGRWRTTEPWGNAYPRPGMTVDIHHGALGSFVLRAPGQRAVRVARVD